MPSCLRSSFRGLPLLGVVLAAAPGCALFGDPLLGSWELVESDHYDPLTTTSTEGDTTTSVTVSGTLDFEEMKDGELVGQWSETFTTTLSSPAGTETSEESEAAEAVGDRESKGEYALDIDGVGDWLCTLSGSELDCEDDDLAQVIYEREASR